MGPDLLVNLILEYKYLIMAPAIFVFGPLVSLAAGVLLRLDAVSLIPTCLALAAGELGADVLWYWIGRRWGELFVATFGRYVGITVRSVQRAKDLFTKNDDIVIFTTKLTAGFGLSMVVLFTAGLSRMPFGRYMMLNITGQFLWTAALLSVGYFLGHIYLKIGNAFEKAALFGLIVIIFLSLIGFGRYLRSQIVKEGGA